MESLANAHHHISHGDRAQGHIINILIVETGGPIVIFKKTLSSIESCSAGKETL